MGKIENATHLTACSTVEVVLVLYVVRVKAIFILENLLIAGCHYSQYTFGW